MGLVNQQLLLKFQNCSTVLFSLQMNRLNEKRSNIYRNKSMTHSEKMHAVEKTYEDEKLEFHEKINEDFVVLDRTWYSHTVEENVMDVLDKNTERTYPTNINS